MNSAIIFKLISVILLTITACFAASCVMGLAMREAYTPEVDVNGWFICISISGALSLLCFALGYGGEIRMFRREAMAVIGLGWMSASLVGAIPYMVIMPNCDFATAFFESTSGLTTTGASAFPYPDSIPPGLMFWRCISQWIGGLGVVVFFVALLSFLGAGAKMLYSNEASVQSHELDTSRVQSGVLRIFAVYATISVGCAAAYHVTGLTWHDSLLHMFTTVSTGGFSPHNESMAQFQSPALEWTCIVFMILGGTSFLALLRLTRFRRSDLKRLTEVYTYLSIIAITSVVIWLYLLAANGWDIEGGLTSYRHSLFHVVSIMTSTGYAIDDYMQWPPVTHIFLLSLMIVGGCTGSTAGGLKVVRMVLAFKVCMRQIERSFRPRVVRPISINGRVMDEPTLEQGTTFLVLAAGICIVSVPILGMLEPNMSLSGTLSAVMASLFNIGPGLAEVGPTENFGHLHPASKIFLAMLMILGRIEFYALLALAMPGMWKRIS